MQTNRMVRTIGARRVTVLWSIVRTPDGRWSAVATMPDDQLVAVWEGDRVPTDDDVEEAIRRRLTAS